jgi:hypothetical protein
VSVAYAVGTIFTASAVPAITAAFASVASVEPD